MRVLKFGGTSVGSPEMLHNVLKIIQSSDREEDFAVVVSAFSGVTNKLENLAKNALSGNDVDAQIQDIARRHGDMIAALQLTGNRTSGYVDSIISDLKEICSGIRMVGELTPRSMARIASAGELMSSAIISAFFKKIGLENRLYDTRDLITTTGSLIGGTVQKERSYDQLRQVRGKARISILPGFISRNENGDTSTLGRGGSDYTAALLAAALSADALEIWTDVSGMMTADPTLVSKARPVSQMSYAEAMELSYFGAKVIYPPTLQPLVSAGIPVWIKNTRHPDEPGTQISIEATSDGKAVKGISSIRGIGLVTVSGSGMVGVPGTAMRMFQALSRAGLNVLFITQSSSEHTITVGLHEDSARKAQRKLREEFEREIERSLIDKVELETNLSLVAAVGDGMRERTGVAAKLFGILGENGVNIRAIAQGSTERNVSFVVGTNDVRKALNALHEGLFLSPTRVAHIYNVGVGNVGSAFLEQVRSQSEKLHDEQRLNIRLAGLANSRKMAFNAGGLDKSKWREELEGGDIADPERMIGTIIGHNARRSVFIDNTGSERVAALYETLLSNSIHVVTSNKIAASAVWDRYLRLKELAGEKGVQFRYETNVAAGLPVINTIRDMLLTGDHIRRIEAVLSGSLNFIFNALGEMRFSEAVAVAREKGLTEPDPAIDLSGLDVKRKILILARECGHPLEMSDVTTGQLIPENLEPGLDWVDLLNKLQKYDNEVSARHAEVVESGRQWRFMATLDGTEAKVGLHAIDAKHPAWVLDGKDNLVLIYSERYNEQPLVIKGAGAGPEVTASGVLSDVLRIVNG